ncbi:MAG: hypothetical protein ACM3X3_11975 [Betaproteobacteria bacterium]
MGKTPKKRPRVQIHAKGFRKVVRVINTSVLVGFKYPPTPEPVCFWWNGQCFRILHILKQYWERPHKYYLVITDRGAFQLCREFRPPKPGRRIPDFQWWLVAEYELYKLPRTKRQLKAPDAPWYWKHTVYPRAQRERPRASAPDRALRPRPTADGSRPLRGAANDSGQDP